MSEQAEAYFALPLREAVLHILLVGMRDRKRQRWVADKNDAPTVRASTCPQTLELVQEG
jgi:hypothetical protein